MHSHSTPQPNKAQKHVRWLALIILSSLTVTGFAVSYTRLHDFVARFGESGWTAYASAGMVDSLALSGLLVALVFQDRWARAAFITSLGFTGFANAYVGWQFAQAFGLVVGLVPILAMEMAYRIALSLVLTPKPLQEVSIPLPTPPGDLQPLPGELQETSKTPPAPSKPLQRDSNLTASDVAQALTSAGGELPTRAEIMRTYRVSEWTARQAVQMTKKSA
jgi:hypothetical protein